MQCMCLHQPRNREVWMGSFDSHQDCQSDTSNVSSPAPTPRLLSFASAQRFKLFNLAALEAVRALPFGPGEDCLFVCNDWHTALLPVLLKVLLPPCRCWPWCPPCRSPNLRPVGHAGDDAIP